VKLERTTALAVAGASALAVSTGGTTRGWQQPNGGLAGARAAVSSPITAQTVGLLRPLWRFELPPGSPYGSFASTPLIADGTVYAEDLSSSVYALDAATGRLRWSYRQKAPNDGPNGIAMSGDRVFGTTDAAVFALDRSTGKRVWAHRLVSSTEQFVSIAPLAARGLVFVSTVGFAPGGRGALYALDQRTGHVRWRFQTIRDPWKFPSAGGGGAWYTPSLAPDGRLYVGISNPDPWGGSKLRPNGGMYPGPVPYTDALVALRADTGKLLWYDQVTKHDVRDYDFAPSPIVVGKTVYGAGKSGRVVAWNRVNGRRLWSTPAGTHLHDLGPLPAKPVTVCPGLWGGVLTPMAYAAGRLFVPSVEQCTKEGATDPAFLPDLQRGKGVVTAIDALTGRKLWTHPFASPPTGCATVAGDVVFVPTLDGRIAALDTRHGAERWQATATAGINSCPSVSGGLLVVGAGAPRRTGATPNLTAYGLPGERSLQSRG
jgi:outer membrane protein assembly factor BamB